VRESNQVQFWVSLSNVTDAIDIKIYSTNFRKLNEVIVIPGRTGGNLVTLDLKDKFGAPLANGIYYLVIQTSQDRLIEKLLILR
jgi:hypothetical protein